MKRATITSEMILITIVFVITGALADQTSKVSSLSDSTADRLQDSKLNSKDNIYIDEDEVEGSGRGGEIREALESDNEDSNFSGSGNYGEDDEDDNLNVNKGGKFNLFEDRTNKVKPNKESKNSIQHSSGDGTDQHIDNDDEDDDHISRTPDDDEDDLYIEKTTNTDPISPPFTDIEDIDNSEKKKEQESVVYGNHGYGIDVNPTQQIPNTEHSPGNVNTGVEGNEVLIMNTKNEDRPTSFFAQPGILAAVIGGAVVGLLCAILVVMFIVYRMRKKDEGSYALDEPKRSPTANSYAKNANNREFYA
ncbi:unnamed protein product [Diamesa hyperborea]